VLKGIWKVASWFGIAAGSLSLINLSLIALSSRSLNPAFDKILNSYQRLVDLTLRLAEPGIEAMLRFARQFISIDLPAEGPWKHVFVLMTLYLVRRALHSFRVGHPATGVFRFVWGLVCALASAIATGTVPSASGAFWPNFLIAGFPVLGLTIYDLLDGIWAATILRGPIASEEGRAAESWAIYSGDRIYHALERALGGFALLLIGLQLPTVLQFRNPGLVMLGVLIIALALWWLVIGAIVASRVRNNEPWLKVFFRTSQARVGLAVLYTCVGALERFHD
jgi:hypothetical protein